MTDLCTFVTYSSSSPLDSVIPLRWYDGPSLSLIAPCSTQHTRTALRHGTVLLSLR